MPLFILQYLILHIRLESICHCIAREPYQQQDMGHVVIVQSPLVEKWKPNDPDDEGALINLVI